MKEMEAKLASGKPAEPVAAQDNTPAAPVAVNDPFAQMAQMYGDAVRCEAVRDEVFEGRKSPMVLGEPEQWLALLIESRLLAGRGEPTHSEELRLRAFDEAPVVADAYDRVPAIELDGQSSCARSSHQLGIH
jgi:protein involved in temperature-dependent protein secretion